MKRINIQLIELPKYNTDYYSHILTNQLLVLPTSRGMFFAISQLPIILEAIAIGQKTIKAAVAPKNKILVMELRCELGELSL